MAPFHTLSLGAHHIFRSCHGNQNHKKTGTKDDQGTHERSKNCGNQSTCQSYIYSSTKIRTETFNQASLKTCAQETNGKTCP